MTHVLFEEKINIIIIIIIYYGDSSLWVFTPNFFSYSSGRKPQPIGLET